MTAVTAACMMVRRDVWDEAGGKDDTPEKQARFDLEVALFRRKWGAELAAGDPYYNPNLTLAKSDFSLRYTRQQRPVYE